jgi:hypothetical protein
MAEAKTRGILSRPAAETESAPLEGAELVAQQRLAHAVAVHRGVRAAASRRIREDAIPAHQRPLMRRRGRPGRRFGR